MKRRVMGLGVFATAVLLAGAAATGCSDAGRAAAPEAGTLALPLSTQAASGTEYRLRDAVFEITPNGYYYASGGEGGASSPETIRISSEDDPSATSIQVSVPEGYYYVQLLSGWRLEKVEGGSATSVEATLLTGAQTWVWVRRHSTSFVEFSFGIGERELWFNGKLNVGVNVYENPDELYGSSGAPGIGGDSAVGGFAGSP